MLDKMKIKSKKRKKIVLEWIRTNDFSLTKLMPYHEANEVYTLW